MKLAVDAERIDAAADEARMRRRAWTLWAFVSLGYMFITSQRTAPGVITDQLLREFKLSASTLGLMSSVQFFMYMILQIPVGLWGDRYGPALFLLFGLVCNGIGTLLYSLADSVGLLFAGRALVGLGDAMIWVNCVIVLSLVFVRKHDFSVALGWTGSMGNIGGILTTMPLAWWITVSGWRVPFTVMGCVLLVHAFVVWRVFRHYSVLSVASGAPRQTSLFSVLREVLFQKRSWPPFFCHFGNTGTYAGFIGLWAVPFLMDTYQLARTEAAGILAFGLIGAVMGGPSISWIAEKTGDLRKTYLAVHIVNISLWILLALLSHPPLALAYGVFFLLGYCMGSGMLTFASIRETFPPTQVGVLSGLANTGGFLSAVLGPPLMGKVFDVMGLHEASSYQVAFLIPCLFAVVGAIGAYGLPSSESVKMKTKSGEMVVKP